MSQYAYTRLLYAAGALNGRILVMNGAHAARGRKCEGRRKRELLGDWAGSCPARGCRGALRKAMAGLFARLWRVPPVGEVA